jgi:hypothetical protein
MPQGFEDVLPVLLREIGDPCRNLPYEVFHSLVRRAASLVRMGFEELMERRPDDIGWPEPQALRRET